jgi:hypothetical protein
MQVNDKIIPQSRLPYASKNLKIGEQLLVLKFIDRRGCDSYNANPQRMGGAGILLV